MAKSRQESFIDRNGGWESVYRNTTPADLPWNAGAPDSELVKLVESGKIQKGPAIDIGTGPGHDAIYLAKHGFNVLALDIAPSAIKLAKSNAKKAGIEGSIEFKSGDVLEFRFPSQETIFVNDRGCFHALAAEDRESYIVQVHRALTKDGLLLLRTFSDKEPPGPGPYRFTRHELEQLFSSRFEFLEFKEGIFEGPLKPKAFFCLLRKKEAHA